jgi:hypothetical protein
VTLDVPMVVVEASKAVARVRERAK